MGKIIPKHVRIRFSVSLKCDCRESNELLLYIPIRICRATLRSKKRERKQEKILVYRICNVELFR